MSAPRPKPGLVVRYEYLWSNQADRGQVEGVKNRPCFVLSVISKNPDLQGQVLICPITHTPPERGQPSIEVPAKLQRHLGLNEGERSWVRLSECNIEPNWPNGLRTTEKGNLEYGMTPPNFYAKVRDGFTNELRRKKVRTVRREGIELAA